MSTAVIGPVSNSVLAQNAVEYVKNTMTIGANNRTEDVIKSVGNPFDNFGGSVTCVIGVKVAEMTMSRILNNMGTLEKIRTIAKVAENRKCGNCGEQSCLAFVYLYDRNVRPLDLMQFANGDHGFVVIGRREGSVAISDWGPDAYVADPWLGKRYQALNLHSFWPGKIPSLIYRASAV